MDSALIRKVAGLAIATLMVFAILYYFAVSQVADTTTPAMAKAIDVSLARSLEKGAASKVTMVPFGKGAGARREYTARFRPSAAVASDAKAVARLCERVAEIVAGEIDDTRREVTIVCVAQDGAGTSIVERAFERKAEDGDLVDVPVPPRRPDPPPGEDAKDEK